jgi:hypothetical protein
MSTITGSPKLYRAVDNDDALTPRHLYRQLLNASEPRYEPQEMGDSMEFERHCFSGKHLG